MARPRRRDDHSPTAWRPATSTRPTCATTSRAASACAGPGPSGHGRDRGRAAGGDPRLLHSAPVAGAAHGGDGHLGLRHLPGRRPRNPQAQGGDRPARASRVVARAGSGDGPRSHPAPRPPQREPTRELELPTIAADDLTAHQTTVTTPDSSAPSPGPRATGRAWRRCWPASSGSRADPSSPGSATTRRSLRRRRVSFRRERVGSERAARPIARRADNCATPHIGPSVLGRPWLSASGWSRVIFRASPRWRDGSCRGTSTSPT